MKATGFVIATTLLAAGCSVFGHDADDHAPVTADAALRAMTANEILGEIGYGETKEDIDVAPSPKYRAYRFAGERGDQIQAQVVALDATDPVLWLTDDAFNVIAMNNDTRATDTNSLLSGRYLPRTGTYYLVFREMYSAPHAKFSVSLRKLGALPADCDPDGEGIWSSDCTEPLDVDPFDPASCEGKALSVADGQTKFGVKDGFRLPKARLYYRTRQCAVTDGSTECSAWVRAFAMDVRFGSITAGAADAPGTWLMLPYDTARKAKLTFSLEPATAKELCIDGPFTNVRGTDWRAIDGGTPGVCGSLVGATVTGLCARFEPKSIELNSGNPNYYTEFGSVLYTTY